MSPASWVEDFLAYLLDVRGFSEETARTYRAALRDFERRMESPDHSQVTPLDLDRYAGRLRFAGLRENTRRNRLSVLRSYFKYAYTRGLIGLNPAENFHPPISRRLERIPTFTTAEINRMIFSFRPPEPVRQPREPAALFSKRQRLESLAEVRDTAILAVTYQLGLRASEPSQLERRDYRTENRVPVVILRGGKRASEPSAYRLDRRVAALLDVYLMALQRASVSRAALFPALTRPPGAAVDRGIGRNQVAALLKRRARRAGIQSQGRRISPHVLRYSVATHLYDRGLRVEEISALLRHASTSTTWRYIRLGSMASIQKKAIHALFWNARSLSPDRGNL